MEGNELEKKAEIAERRRAALARAREAKKVKEIEKKLEAKESGEKVAFFKTVPTETNLDKFNSSEPTIKWFSEVDINPKTGLPSADYPGWYFEKLIEEMESDIISLEQALDLDLYKGRKKKEAILQLDKKRKRLDSIMESRPKLVGADKDRVANVVKELGERIHDSMPCYSDMQRGAGGNVDIEAEARRMVLPCIDVKSQIEADFYKQRGIVIQRGQVSRNDAVNAWKIFSKSLEADTCDAESLRNKR